MGSRGVRGPRGSRGLGGFSGSGGLGVAAPVPGGVTNSAFSTVQQQDYSATVWLRKKEAKMEHSQQKCIVIFALVCCFAVLTALIFSSVDFWGEDEDGITEENCRRTCRVVLVENIPKDVFFLDNETSYLPLVDGLHDLLDQAVRSVEIVSPLWLLNSSDYEASFQPAARQGRALLEELQGLKARGINLKISSGMTDSTELRTLDRHSADVHYVNMTALTNGHLHSSFWVVDRKHLYFGSASMDWRSLAMRKELGVLVYDCSCLALDLHRVFSLYWGLQYRDFIPSFWSKRVFGLFNRDSPLELTLNSTKAEAYVSGVMVVTQLLGLPSSNSTAVGRLLVPLAFDMWPQQIGCRLDPTLVKPVEEQSSPSVLIPKDRSSDLEAISRVIQEARHFIYISITDYLPLLSNNPHRYWSRIDGLLREALILRKVRVRLLVSCWEQTHPLTFNFVWSLRNLCMEQSNCSLEAKFFSPRKQGNGSFQRINHNRFMVTDRALYLGNLDWVGNEFTFNGGAGLVISQPEGIEEKNATIVEQIKAAFERDWFSCYTRTLQSNKVCNKVPVCRKRHINGLLPIKTSQHGNGPAPIKNTSRDNAELHGNGQESSNISHLDRGSGPVPIGSYQDKDPSHLDDRQVQIKINDHNDKMSGLLPSQSIESSGSRELSNVSP